MHIRLISVYISHIMHFSHIHHCRVTGIFWKRELTFGTGWDGESHDLLDVVNDSPSLQTGMYLALGRLYRWARTLQTSLIPDLSASKAFHHGGFSGSGTWNLLAAAYTTPQATTSLLNRTHNVVRKLLKKEKWKKILDYKISSQI